MTSVPDPFQLRVVAAMLRLDALPDEPFAHYGLNAAAVAVMRERFAGWPRVTGQGQAPSTRSV